MRDLDSFRSSLVLNGVITAEEEIEEPKYSLQPGWDNEEAEQLSQGESEWLTDNSAFVLSNTSLLPTQFNDDQSFKFLLKVCALFALCR